MSKHTKGSGVPVSFKLTTAASEFSLSLVTFISTIYCNLVSNDG